ncbi:MAG: hypothetical protein Q4D63_07115 [Neisseria animaloris]|nr:hypothetical protein [Neisseria animaloris]
MNNRFFRSFLSALILSLPFAFSAAADTLAEPKQTTASNSPITKTAETATDEQPKINNLTASQAEMLQDNISALRMQVMDNQQQNIKWWLAAIALMGAIVPYLFYKQSEERMLNQFRALLDQAKEHSKQTQISANQAQEYSEKTQTLATQAETHSEKAQTLAAQAKESASNAQAHLDEIQSFHSQEKKVQTKSPHCLSK